MNATEKACAKTCPLRREFLRTCVQHAAIAALLPTATQLVGCGGSETSPSPTGSGAGTTTGGVTHFAFSDNPQLKTVGGTISTEIGGKPYAVVRLSATTAAVLSTVCPHEGCTVGDYSDASKNFTCPCHGAQFAGDGSLQKGPARTGLTAYPATISDTDISATLP